MILPVLLGRAVWDLNLEQNAVMENNITELWNAPTPTHIDWKEFRKMELLAVHLSVSILVFIDNNSLYKAFMVTGLCALTESAY